MGYDELIQEALATPFEGWDFAVFDGRMMMTSDLPWDYAGMVRERLPGTASLLDLDTAVAALTGAGLDVTWRREAGYPVTIGDVGALVLFLRIIPWQMPGFDVHRYGDRLRAVHEEMERGRPLGATAHRFALVARHREGQ